MNKTEYFVDFKLHNKTNGGWAFKTTLHTDSLPKAKKEYHNLLTTYGDSKEFDIVTVVLSDMYGNPILHETDIMEEPVEAEATE